MGATEYIIIAIVLVAAVLALIWLSGKRNKTRVEVIEESKDAVAANRQYVEMLLVLAEDNEAVTDELKQLQDDLRYLTPSVDPKVKEIDKKIKGVLEDLKLEMGKGKSLEDNAKVEGLIKDVKMKIAERSIYTKH